MQFEVFIPGLKQFVFQETNAGILDLILDEQAGKDVPEKIATAGICFDFEELDKQAYLSWQGEMENSVIRSINYRFLVKAIKILTYAQAGATYKCGTWINHDFVSDKGLLSLFKKMIGDEKLQEIFFEYVLGQFDYGKNEQDVNNLTFMFGGMPRDLEEEAYNWYKKTKKFSTRVVGFRYRQERFVKVVNGEEILKMKPGQDVLVIREPENKYDNNAVSFILNNGEKIGYVRKTIASFLARLMDKGRIYQGKVSAVLADYRDEDERVYVELMWV